MEENTIQIVIRVVKADLTKNFESMGKMDPYAKCSIEHSNGAIDEIGQTRTDWNAHMSPVWNHTFTGQPFIVVDKVIINVWEDDVVGNDDLIGEVSLTVEDLFEKSSASEEATGKVKDFKIKNKKDVVGSVSVQALLVKCAPGSVTLGQKALTRVDTDLFESPVVRLGVSGGTAPFFRMKMKNPGARENGSPGFYIGKDLSHAADEIMFYEQLSDVIEGSGGPNFAPLLKFCFEYLGVATCAIADAKPDSKPKELIIMRNLFDGAVGLRLLDIKIGQKTADAGWQGKSRMAALKQSVVDGLTNSAAEGYRLEGFDGMPPVLESMNPLLDMKEGKMKKKAFRCLLQTRSGAEVMGHFLDVHLGPADCGEDKIQTTYSPIEFAEVVCSEIVKRLTRLSIACRMAPIPQKWIGSSVALAFDSGQLPLRTNTDVAIRKAVKVHIFDWGRSELNSIENNNSMKEAERKDRALFWGYYVGGIDRLAFEACRHYYNRFCMATEWADVQCIVMDFDSNSADDFLGKCTLTLKVTPETTVNLVDNSGKAVTTAMIGGKKSTLTYSIKLRQFPSGSRLKSAWQITIHKANSLISSDKLKGRASSDPFVIVNALSKDGERCFRQQTTVKPKCLDPVYNETLEVPLAAREDLFEETVRPISPELVTLKPSVLFPPEATTLSQRGTPRKDRDEEALKVWQERLDSCAADSATLEPYFRGEDPFAPSQPSKGEPPLPSPGSSLSNMMKDLKEARERIGKEDEHTAEAHLKAQGSGIIPVELSASKLGEVPALPPPFPGVRENPSREPVDVEVTKTNVPPLCGLCGEGNGSRCSVM